MLPVEDTIERFLGSDRPPSGGAECRGAGDEKDEEEVDEEDDDYDDDDDEEENETNPSVPQTRRQRRSQQPQRERSADAEPPKRTPVNVVIPERRAAIGQHQELFDEDQDFLRYAFEHNVPLEMQQRNPKLPQSKSRRRYEKYKLARTLREAKKMGAHWGDLIWDYSRGYIDFRNASANVTIEQLEARRLDRGVSISPAAVVDGDDNLVLGHPFGGLTFEESIQQDYAVMAMEHIEDMSDREQRMLQRALGNQTLTNFAHCCASRIMVPEPLSVGEAAASEHAAEWRAAMDEEISNLEKFRCFNKVPRSQALNHGRLVKSKWVFKVKYNSDNTIQRFRARLVAKGFIVKC